MPKLKINHFCGQPVRKEYKAPFVASALVYGDIVGFCFKDFCTKIYLSHKHNLLMSFEPEFIFGKMIALKDRYGSGKMPSTLKGALDLLLLKGSDYRPWYICDTNPYCVELFKAERIGFHHQLYEPIVSSIIPDFDHPYLQLALSLYTKVEGGVYFVDGYKLIDEINYLVGRKIYEHVKKQICFRHDTFFSQLYELGLCFISSNEKKFKLSHGLIMLTYWLFDNTDLKSAANLLVMAHHRNPNFIEKLKKAYSESDWILTYSNTVNYSHLLKRAMAELEQHKTPVIHTKPKEIQPSRLSEFYHWQDTEAKKRSIEVIFNQIPDEHKEAVLYLMEAAKRCGELDESDRNNPDL